MNKTGTSSLNRAMTILGYKSIHCPIEISQVMEYDFLCDIAITARYKFLDFVFPKAKWILTIREPQSWLRSILTHRVVKGNHYRLRDLEYDFLLYGSNSCHNEYKFDPEAYLNKLHQHTEEVKSHFQGRENQLLIIDICGGEQWERLCTFLEKPIPEARFPHANKTSEGSHSRATTILQT